MNISLEQLQKERAQAKKEVELADHLVKLQKNRSFQKVVNEFLLDELAINAASLYGNPGLGETSQKSLENTLIMISTLKGKLQLINTNANAALDTLQGLDEAEEEYMSERGE